MVAFELAVQDMHGVAVAARLGVDRIELCSALPLGGVTPSLALVEAAAPGPPAHVLVRPRPGGFHYTADEAALILRDVRLALDAGATGVVVGALDGDRVDTELIRRVLDAAAGAPVTFHRAFDTLPDPAAALETLIGLGVHRVLTSAGATDVADALPALAGLVTAAAGRIEIMAGGGVRPGLIDKIVRTGVPAVHASAKRTVAETMAIGLGSATGTGRETTDEDAVRQILSELR